MNKINCYLIKRSGVFRDIIKSNSKNKRYFEITISNKKIIPPSVNLKENDVIYIAETSGGIYAKGIITFSDQLQEFNNIHDIIEFSRTMNDDSYWLDKIHVYSQKTHLNNLILRYHAYYVRQTVLNRTIPYNGPIKRFSKPGFSHVFFKLNAEEVAYLNNPDYNLNKVQFLKSVIPGDLRLKIYSFLNKKYSIGHLIDIDHFVPKSLGGPGNIIENLVPIGLSLNRYKSDSVPKSFFEEALTGKFAHRFEKYKKDLLSILKINKDFISKNDFKKLHELARELNNNINLWESIDEARIFYYNVLERNHPSYAKIIKEFDLIT